MINKYLLPELERLGINKQEVVYMHDGEPAHASNAVKLLLLNHFSPFIGRGTEAFISWPPRSPALNPLDFFSLVFH